MSNDAYVHGYSVKETQRLTDQAETLAELLHYDTRYPTKSSVLEVGCGTGAQTVILAGNSPEAHFISVDISETSVKQTGELIRKENISNVQVQQADVFDLPFGKDSFDHIFVCFLLEHLDRPVQALKHLKKVLKPKGSITVIEGDHGSAYFYPDSSQAKLAIRCLIELQSRAGGNSLVGRQLYPLLKEAGFENVRVSPRAVYVDASRPELVEGFTKKTFTAMVEGVKNQALTSGMLDEQTWNKGISDLYRTAQSDGTFNYTFFKATGVK
jgi:ubiquinone/menaquinone biosynthesis C-methylase UbiE